MIEQLDTPQAASAWCAAERAAGRSIGFVPTMGALHEGHLSLARAALAECDLCVVSIFVNPLQFNDPGDLERYPRDLGGDARKLEEVGVQLVFTGTLAGFFPEELAGGALPEEQLLDPGPSALGLEGALRPGHFEGVVTIVDRLFDVVRPDRAFFGSKDFQQCLVVRELAARRGGPEVVVCPTAREEDGLARSSRNQLLDGAGREAAPAIHRALQAARRAWQEEGIRDPSALSAILTEVLGESPLTVEYAEVRDPHAWTELQPSGPMGEAVALVAASAGPVRLIDNLHLS